MRCWLVFVVVRGERTYVSTPVKPVDGCDITPAYLVIEHPVVQGMYLECGTYTTVRQYVFSTKRDAAYCARCLAAFYHEHESQEVE